VSTSENVQSNPTSEHRSQHLLHPKATNHTLTVRALEQHNTIHQCLDAIQQTGASGIPGVQANHPSQNPRTSDSLIREPDRNSRPLFLLQVNTRNYTHYHGFIFLDFSHVSTGIRKAIDRSRDFESISVVCSQSLFVGLNSRHDDEWLVCAEFDDVTASNLCFLGIGSQFESELCITCVKETHVEEFI